MPRLLFRPLAVALLVLAGLLPAVAQDETVRYLLPVSYDMVITRPGVSTTTTSKGVTTEKVPYSFEVFATRDLLKLILGVSTDAETKGWSLYARSDSATFTDPDGLETLELIARRKNDAEEPRTLPEGMSFSLLLSTVSAYSSSSVRDDAATGPVLSKREGIIQLATLTQALPARGTRSAGTLETTGYLSHGLVYDKVTIGGETTAAAINFPTSAVYRASGMFKADTTAEDGIAEVLISFGAPTLEFIETAAE